jgi:hypothetical protein
MANPFMQYENFVYLLAAQDITGTATASSYLDLKTATAAGFLVVVGAITGTSTDTEVITVEAATAVDGTEVAQSFRYRISGAFGTNTWGAVTTCASTGLALTVSDDNKIVFIEIDPQEMAVSDYRYVRVVCTDTPDMANFIVAVIGVIQPRYMQTTYHSATAAASA